MISFTFSEVYSLEFSVFFFFYPHWYNPAFKNWGDHPMWWRFNTTHHSLHDFSPETCWDVHVLVPCYPGNRVQSLRTGRVFRQLLLIRYLSIPFHVSSFPFPDFYHQRYSKIWFEFLVQISRDMWDFCCRVFSDLTLRGLLF